MSADFSESIIGYSLFDVAKLSYYEATGFLANDGEMLICDVIHIYPIKDETQVLLSMSYNIPFHQSSISFQIGTLKKAEL